MQRCSKVQDESVNERPFGVVGPGAKTLAPAGGAASGESRPSLPSKIFGTGPFVQGTKKRKKQSPQVPGYDAYAYEHTIDQDARKTHLGHTPRTIFALYPGTKIPTSPSIKSDSDS